ncbi:SAM-dependent methyltransferase [Allonocardiopsis opalescens]|uniref:S-adenosyl methyltransferase n=1 Tax=Allonocardiopsis opalescens TaxID=1144618 RepID=A0A2T0Q0V3_9ACTN|nr:SAM-dependent methyltransferase [Allonocardiopsis opalescens]PRX97345.1 S-adenosyl methyltransferase [Allonocardiopsis opalescens]
MTDYGTLDPDESFAPDARPPSGIDTSTASVARLYDYFLGGKDNYAVDRAAAAKVREVAPEVPAMARAMRAWLVRVVRFLSQEAGIRQYLDLGAGLPTQDNVHQVAKRHQPDARVVYVDNDPIVLAHGRALLEDDESTTVIQADMMEPETILGHPETRRLLDFEEPMALLLSGVLHFIPDELEPDRFVAELRERLAPGSYLAIASVVGDTDPDAADRLLAVYRSQTGTGAHRRSGELERFFGDFKLVDPGLTFVNAWRPERPEDAIGAERFWVAGGVALKG